MPARPPVGSGLYRVLVKVPMSPFWNPPRTLAVALSFFCQLMLVTQRASNFERAFSMVTAVMAGSMANARMASSLPTPRPVNATRSSTTDALAEPPTPMKLNVPTPPEPRLPVSRATAIASWSVM